jgi:hypothetical protein
MRNPYVALVAVVAVVIAAIAAAAWIPGSREPRIEAPVPIPEPPPPAPPPLPADPTEPPVIGKVGFFHLERQEGTWWLVDPDGQRFVTIGMNHVEPSLVLSDVNRRQTLARYGRGFVTDRGAPDREGPEVQRWLKDAMAQVRSWGFNTLGMHNPVPQSEMPYVAVFRPAKIDSWQKQPVFPDPFDPATAADIDRQAAAFCAKHAEDELVLGYGFNDWVDWHLTPGRRNPWIAAIMAMPPDAPGKRVWVDHLRGRYESVAEAAQAYAVRATTWEEFAAQRSFGAPNALTQEDTLSFLPIVARQWYTTVASAVRRHDPNHLILGDKLDASYDFPDWIDPVVDEAFDLVYLQWFARFDQQQERLDRFYANTGKAVLIGDSGFSTPSPFLAEPKPVQVDSSEEVGREYERYLEAVMRQPYVVGWHWCGYIMGSPDLLKTVGFWPSKQYGLLDPDGTPHKTELQHVVAANANAVRWHTEVIPFDPARVVPAPARPKMAPPPTPAKAPSKAPSKAKTPSPKTKAKAKAKAAKAAPP